jgi:3-hydroxyisobutyrate dehydrogenase
MLKDLSLAQEAARATGVPTPLGAEAMQLYQLFVANGNAGVDFSGIIEFIRGKSK